MTVPYQSSCLPTGNEILSRTSAITTGTPLGMRMAINMTHSSQTSRESQPFSRRDNSQYDEVFRHNSTQQPYEETTVEREHSEVVRKENNSPDKNQINNSTSVIKEEGDSNLVEREGLDYSS